VRLGAAAVLFAISLYFVHRSFYGMRIQSGSIEAAKQSH
jgi:hypothetical protein